MVISFYLLHHCQLQLMIREFKAILKKINKWGQHVSSLSQIFIWVVFITSITLWMYEWWWWREVAANESSAAETGQIGTAHIWHIPAQQLVDGAAVRLKHVFSFGLSPFTSSCPRRPRVAFSNLTLGVCHGCRAKPQQRLQHLFFNVDCSSPNADCTNEDAR